VPQTQAISRHPSRPSHGEWAGEAIGQRGNERKVQPYDTAPTNTEDSSGLRGDFGAGSAGKI